MSNLFGAGNWEVLQVGSNRTEIRTPRGIVGFSYSTPVIVYCRRAEQGFKMSSPPSKTSFRHIRLWGTDFYTTASYAKIVKIAADVLGIKEDL